MFQRKTKQTREKFHWKTATYLEWNKLLLDYFLITPPNKSKQIEQIPANPEELLTITSDNKSDTNQIVDAFVITIKESLPFGKSFCGFCLDYKGWDPNAQESPHFFGMLWFTCLVAAGYPHNCGSSFQERFENLIGNRDQLRCSSQECLNQLWEDLAKWSYEHPETSELVLPPKDENRSVIGRSYYLAFPSRPDRKILAEVLRDQELIGFDPPIIPTVNTLEHSLCRFSADFRKVFQDFRECFRSGKQDPADSAFWRAIRTEAAHTLLEDEGGTENEFTILATWDDDETLLLQVASNREYGEKGIKTLPRTVHLQDKWSHYLVDEFDSIDTIMSRLLEGQLKLDRMLSSLIKQGILIFSEDIAGEYRLVYGEHIEGADVALVHKDCLEALQNTFGGRSEESRFEDWYELEDCQFRQLKEPPPGLEEMTQLLYTSNPPRPRLVDGIRLPHGYLYNSFLKPVIRCPSAEQVYCFLDDTQEECKPSDKPGEWSLPTSIESSLPTSVDLIAKFSVELDGHTFRREGRVCYNLAEGEYRTNYKTVRKGNYWREGCVPEQIHYEPLRCLPNRFCSSQILELPQIDLPLDITVPDASKSRDLLLSDPSIRYLGPGLGEISTTRNDHPWLVLGTRNKPYQIVFLGDLDSPVLPDCSESADKGNCRTWSYAFTYHNAKVTALIDGKYISLSDDARLQKVFNEYQSRARRNSSKESRNVVDFPRPNLWFPDTCVTPLNQTTLVLDAIASLGNARSGFPLKELQDLICRLVGTQDYILSQQLIRAWSEAGLLDLLRMQDRSQTFVVPRSPKFILVRRGPKVDATLIGLVPSKITKDLRNSIQKISPTTTITQILSTTEFQPPVLKLIGAEIKEIFEISCHMGFQKPDWLSWANAEKIPDHLLISSNPSSKLPYEKPSEAYLLDAIWDWNHMKFLRHREGPSEIVEVERRRHSRRCSIYVVLVDKDPMLWCYFQNWSLLWAAELRECPPFSILDDGIVSSVGISPIHLPLAFGRLCTILGTGLPGPKFDADKRVDEYIYPFGRAQKYLIQKILPPAWINKL